MNSLLDEELCDSTVVSLDNDIDPERLGETQLKCFKRYDFDDHRTLNNTERLMQLCTNLAFKLNLEVTFAELQAVVIEHDLDARGFGFEEFKQWFDQVFLCHQDMQNCLQTATSHAQARHVCHEVWAGGPANEMKVDEVGEPLGYLDRCLSRTWAVSEMLEVSAPEVVQAAAPAIVSKMIEVAAPAVVSEAVRGTAPVTVSEVVQVAAPAVASEVGPVVAPAAASEMVEITAPVAISESMEVEAARQVAAMNLWK